MSISFRVKHLSGDGDCIWVVCNFIGIVLVSYGCYKKIPQIWWIKTTHICSYVGQLSEIGFSWPNPRCQQTYIPPRNYKGESIPCPSIFWWLLAFLAMWPSHSSHCLHGHVALSSSVCNLPLPHFWWVLKKSSRFFT